MEELMVCELSCSNWLLILTGVGVLVGNGVFVGVAVGVSVVVAVGVFVGVAVGVSVGVAVGGRSTPVPCRAKV